MTGLWRKGVAFTEDLWTDVEAALYADLDAWQFPLFCRSSFTLVGAWMLLLSRLHVEHCKFVMVRAWFLHAFVIFAKLAWLRLSRIKSFWLVWPGMNRRQMHSVDAQSLQYSYGVPWVSRGHAVGIVATSGNDLDIYVSCAFWMVCAHLQIS